MGCFVERKMGQLVHLFLLIAIVDSVFVVQGQAFQDALSILTERWRWEAYWGQGIARAPFKPFEDKPMELYSARSVSGFCIPHLNYCASYERDGVRLGRLLIRGRCGAAYPAQRCVMGFIESNAPASLNWATADVSISIERVSVGMLERDSTEATPTSLKRVEVLKSWLAASVFVEPATDRTIIIPYISGGDPEVYVLLEVPKPGISAVLIIRRGLDGDSFENAGEIASIWPKYEEYRKRIIQIEAWRGVLP